MKVNKRQPLDWAAKMGHPQVVKALHNSETHEVDANALKWIRVYIESLGIIFVWWFFHLTAVAFVIWPPTQVLWRPYVKTQMDT